MQEFSQTVEGLRQAHQLLTASLFRYQAHLFLYLESVGTALAPDGLSPLLDALLCPWPAAVGEALPRRWVAMQPYFTTISPPLPAIGCVSAIPVHSMGALPF